MNEKKTAAGNPMGTGLGDLASYLEKSSHVVQEYTDIIEHKYARPALNQIFLYFQAQSITMTCAMVTFALFTVMSILPVLLFIGISVFAMSGLVFFAFTSVVVAVVVVETMFATALLFVLGGLLLFSFVLTTVGAMACLAFCLGQHFQAQGLFGITEWAQEIKQHFPFAPVKREDIYDADTSAVLVAFEDIGKVKTEDGSRS